MTWHWISQHNAVQDGAPVAHIYRAHGGARRSFLGYVHAASIQAALAIAQRAYDKDCEVWA